MRTRAPATAPLRAAGTSKDIEFDCHEFDKLRAMKREPPRHAQVEIEVRYAETDQMGVVHHANWIVWLELARTKLCLDAGFHYSEIEKQGLLLLVTGVQISYRGAARYGESVVASCWVEEVGSRGVTFAYHVRRGDSLLATAQTEHIWVDTHSRRPVRFPEALKAPFESYLPQRSMPAVPQPSPVHAPTPVPGRTTL